MATFKQNIISQIDRFDASWSSIEKKEGDHLKYLKTIATVQSVNWIQHVSTAKRVLIDLIAQHLIGQYGKGAGIYYAAL